jgi:hypothetical protein
VSAPQVGDVVTTAEEFEALPIQTVILDASGDAGQRLGNGWHFPETIPLPSARAAKYGPATILYLPGQPPRPERVVKAEALREWAAEVRGASPEDVYIPLTPARLVEVHLYLAGRGGIDALWAHVMRWAARLAEQDADRIERGDA